MKLKKMSVGEYVWYGLILLAITAVAFSAVDFFAASSSGASGAAKNPSGAKQYEAITTGTTGEGDVEISLVPSLSGERLAVSATFNTHSVDLSQYDLQQLVSLSLGTGSGIILPEEAFSLSGHHGSGQILFKVGADIDKFTIIITGIPALPERKYAWT